jgi:hypothetical protein
MADQPRFRNVFVSPNGKYEFKYKSGKFSEQNWSLINKITGETLYGIVGEFSSRTVLVSDDGRTLVVVDDWSNRQPGPELDVLVFYRNGSLLKKYSLGDLLKDISNIERSVSHFQWFFQPSTLSVVDSQLKLQTFELTDYEFDIHTGDLLTKQTSSVLSEGSSYVYGKVKKLGAGRFEIEVCQHVYGAVSKGGKLEFVAEQSAFHSDNYYSVVIKDGKLVAKKDVMLNSCNYQRSNRP